MKNHEQVKQNTIFESMYKISVEDVMNVLSDPRRRERCANISSAILTYVIENLYAVRNKKSLSKKNTVRSTDRYTRDEKYTHGYEKNVKTMTVKISM